MSRLAELRVLVVDDQASMRGLTKAHLRELGFEKIEDAPSGNKAFQTISDTPFDLIISDWIMKDGDGLSLLSQLRAHPEYNETPFIMATIKGKIEHVHAAVEAGVNGYLLKPFDAKMLQRKIERIFGPIEEPSPEH